MIDVLLYQVQLAIRDENRIYNIPPSFRVNDINLPKIIKLLKQRNSSLANLTCALLLDGTLPTCTIETKLSDSEYAANRLNAALEFYAKAYQQDSKDVVIKNIAEFRLWELRTTIDLGAYHSRH